MKKLINESLNDYSKGGKIPKYFTIGELIEHLSKLDHTLPVVKVGHFGEIYPMSAYNFHTRHGHPVPEDDHWKDRLEESIPVLDIYVPDIGPDPD